MTDVREIVRIAHIGITGSLFGLATVIVVFTAVFHTAATMLFEHAELWLDTARRSNGHD